MINMTRVQVLSVKRRIIGRTLLEVEGDIPHFHFASNTIVATDGSSHRGKSYSMVFCQLPA